ncbi:MAG TPA: hypothetical protein VGH19_03130 [Verrucomicrobiae bacterium]
MKTHSLVRLATLLTTAVASLLATCSLLAQADKYRPGDKIEYLESPIKDLWEPGVYMYATPDGKQPIIRKKPNEFYPDGSQTAYSWERIRPLGTKPAAKPTVEAPAKTTPAQPPAPVATKPAAPAPTATQTLPATAGGLMTQEEVLNFLQTRLGDQPFAHPQREQIRKELAEMIKKRGVNFRYQTLSDFSNQLGKYGASSDIIFPLQANYGPPTKEPWYIGKWSLSKIGATVDYKGNDGYIYRQTEIGVKDVGSIIITADGRYTWDIDVPKGVAQGTWRKAKPEEMPYQGGDAIVLQKAKGGVDWIVHQDRVTELKGDWVNIAQLDSRQIREGGFREVKK